MSAWESYEYEISYVDPEEMSHLRVYTDREHLLEALDRIFAKHGYQVRIKKKVLTKYTNCSIIKLSKIRRENMKRQIRQSCFETNSSSTHAICIATDDVLNIPKDIHFGFDDFGWECDTHSSIRTKASYLYTCLPYVAKDYNTFIEYVTFIYNTLKSHGVENITMDNFEIGIGTWGDIYFYIKPANDCYVDHGSCANEFVEAVCTDEDKLLHYLFSNKSYVETGNDNDSYDVGVNVDYPHEEYYKGN